MKKNLTILITATLLIAALLSGCGQKNSSASIAGTYERNYTEEIGGDVIDCTDTITLNEDHTCEAIFQDTVKGTWNDTTIIFDSDMAEYEYHLDGNELTVTINDIPTVFEKVTPGK